MKLAINIFSLIASINAETTNLPPQSDASMIAKARSEPKGVMVKKGFSFNDVVNDSIYAGVKGPQEETSINGSPYDAERHSYNNRQLTIYLSGSIGAAKSAKEYADDLVKYFADKRFTDNPTDIVVFYEESGEPGHTTGTVYINGKAYESKSGMTAFPLTVIGQYIDVFADAHAKAN